MKCLLFLMRKFQTEFSCIFYVTLCYTDEFLHVILKRCLEEKLMLYLSNPNLLFELTDEYIQRLFRYFDETSDVSLEDTHLHN